MNAQTQASTITAVISTIYDETGVTFPTVERCITPLSELIESYGGLICTEIHKLSSQAAINYLIGQGGLIDIPEGLDVNKEPLAGFLYTTPNFGAIFVEQDDMLVRRRFTIAHELGHYFLHRPLLADSEEYAERFLVETMNTATESADQDEAEELPSGRLIFNRVADTASQLPSFEQMEREANQFAVEVLMPEPIIRAKVRAYTPYFQGEDLVWRLATEMLLSRAAIRYRLHDLRLSTTSKARWN